MYPYKLALSFTGFLWLLGWGSIAQASTLSITSAVVNPGGTATLSLGLTVSGTAPVGLQWTITYSPTQISAISIEPGPGATAAGKTLSCGSGTGTVTCILAGLNANADASGVVAYLNATIAPSVTTASIQVGNSSGVSAAGNGLSVTSAVTGTISVPSLSPLTCSPAGVSAAGVSTCTVTLTQTAPTGGSSVTLASNNTLLTVPGTVTVAAGATTATFSATAGATIASNQSATVTATLGTSSQTAAISLLASAGTVSSVACSPTSLSQSAVSTCTVTLAAKAPTGGSAVTLASNNALLTVPGTVTVAAGATTATFSATAAASIASNQSATVTATLGTSSQTAGISLVAPVVVSGVACSPTSLGQSAVSTCTVTLTQTAPAGGSSVTLSGNNPLLTIPASVTVPVGATTATFSATAGAAIASNQSATVTATLGTSSQTATINLVSAISVTQLACSPSAVKSGGTSTCTVTLQSAASSGGSTVSLLSSNKLLTIPSSVTVTAGAVTASFKASAGSFKTSGTATVTASLNGSTATATVTLSARSGGKDVVTTSKAQTAGEAGTSQNAPSSALPGNTVSSLLCSPKVISAGGVATCELRVATNSQSMPIALNSSSEQMLVPAVVTTRPNQSSLTFQAQSDIGSKHHQVKITATAGSAEVEDTILLMAASGPVLRVPKKQAARTGTPASFTVSAADPSGLPVQLAAAAIPAGASFDPSTGVFEWTPTTPQAGKYGITFTATNSAGQSSTAQVKLEVDSGPPALNAPAPSCSPGAIATLNGTSLAAPGSQLSDPTGASFALGGTSVTANGAAVAVLYSSADRVDFLCPTLETGVGTQLSVEVTSPFGSSQPMTIGTVEAVPTILSMDDSPQNQGLISFNGMNDLVMERNFRVPSHPAQPGDQIVIFATGLGSAADSSTGAISVELGDTSVEVDSVQAVPGYAGVYALQVRVPETMTFGEAAVQLQIMTPDGHQFNSNSVTAAFEAVRQ